VRRSKALAGIAGALLLISAAPANAAQASEAAASEAADKAAIVRLIADMEAAWNRGDFAGYMEGFLNPDVVFVSRGRFQRDWQGTLDHYVRDYGTSEATRGRLHFCDLRIEMLAPDAAQLISRFHLAATPGQSGINTRLMRKVKGQWRIALNHVSAFEPDAATPPYCAEKSAEGSAPGAPAGRQP